MNEVSIVDVAVRIGPLSRSTGGGRTVCDTGVEVTRRARRRHDG
jgi:hypothetical protein